MAVPQKTITQMRAKKPSPTRHKYPHIHPQHVQDVSCKPIFFLGEARCGVHAFAPPLAQAPGPRRLTAGVVAALPDALPCHSMPCHATENDVNAVANLPCPYRDQAILQTRDGRYIPAPICYQKHADRLYLLYSYEIQTIPLILDIDTM